MTAGLSASAQKAQFPFLAHVAMALISAMLFPTFTREETQQSFAIPPTHPAWLEFGSSGSNPWSISHCVQRLGS
jgi:hypothetical protein